MSNKTEWDRFRFIAVSIVVACCESSVSWVTTEALDWRVVSHLGQVWSSESQESDRTKEISKMIQVQRCTEPKSKKRLSVSRQKFDHIDDASRSLQCLQILQLVAQTSPKVKQWLQHWLHYLQRQVRSMKPKERFKKAPKAHDSRLDMSFEIKVVLEHTMFKLSFPGGSRISA